MVFKNGRLEPHALAFWATNRALRLVNDQDETINLMCDPRLGHGFNLAIPARQSVVHTIKPGAHGAVPAFIKSNSFESMSPGVLLACGHPYFALSDADGRFTLKDVPIGEMGIRRVARARWMDHDPELATWSIQNRPSLRVTFYSGLTLDLPPLGLVPVVPALLLYRFSRENVVQKRGNHSRKGKWREIKTGRLKVKPL
jgi:hypothetical protein